MDLPNINNFTKESKEMINFKRIAGILALTMALVQVMPAVPVEATELVDEAVADEGVADDEVVVDEEVDEEIVVDEEVDDEEVDDEAVVDGEADDEGKEEECWHEKCDNVAKEGTIICEDCYGKSSYTVKPIEGNAEKHAEVSCCTNCESILYDDAYPHWDSDMNGYCDACEYPVELSECVHVNCSNKAGLNSECPSCRDAMNNNMTFEGINEDGYHVVLHTCTPECGESKSIPYFGHWNYSDGYCICGVYIGTPGGGQGSASGNSVPKEEKPASKAPTEEEVAEQRAEAISKAVEEKIAAEEAIPVTSFVSAEAVNAIPAEVKGTTTEAVFNVSKITTTRGFVAAVDKIVKANPEGKSVTFYSEKPFAFNTNSLAAMADANKEFVYMFKHEGQLYKVTIPAGAKVDLAGQKFAGPLYIGAQLGTSVLVK